MTILKINYPMLRRIVLRVARRRFISIFSLAKHKEVICPEERIKLDKAIYLKNSLEKVTGQSPWRLNWQQDYELITGAIIISPPAYRFTIPKVDIVGAFLYSGAAKMRAGYGPERVFNSFSNNYKIIERANLVTSYAGSMFFGPLLVDDFSLELNALDPNENIKMVTKPYHHEAEYRQLLGLQQTRLVEFGNVRELILYEEPAINSLKRNKYFELRQRLTRNVKGLYAQNKYIYLKRGSSGEKRILHNEREIEELLNSLGFIIVEPSSMSVREIVEKTINAKIVVTVEGSHISHVVFTMSPNGAMVVLQPPDRFSAVYKEIADCLGIKYAFLVGDPVEQGFKIDKNDVQRILDIINF
jgi:hypothetical protein